MNIAIGTIAIILGLLCGGVGGLAFFGGMMSDDPAAAHDAASGGCLALAGGAALIAFGVWMILH